MTTEAFTDLAETFEFLDDWEDRYRHVIELGKSMPEMDPALCVPANKVDGCASQVWLFAQIDGAGPTARMGFVGASDALIVSGLIAVLHALYDGVSVKEALEIDAAAELAQLGLNDHLSAQRSNGLRAMIERLRHEARTVAEG